MIPLGLMVSGVGVEPRGGDLSLKGNSQPSGAASTGKKNAGF